MSQVARFNCVWAVYPPRCYVKTRELLYKVGSYKVLLPEIFVVPQHIAVAGIVGSRQGDGLPPFFCSRQEYFW